MSVQILNLYAAILKQEEEIYYPTEYGFIQIFLRSDGDYEANHFDEDTEDFLFSEKDSGFYEGTALDAIKYFTEI